MKEQANKPPFGELLCVRDGSIMTIVGTTGTTGEQTIVPLTEFDSTQYCSPDSETWLRTLYSSGFDEEKDIVQSAWNYGFWYFSGSCLSFTRRRTIPPHIITGIGRTKFQIETMKKLRSTIFFATQSYGLYVGQKVREMGIDPSKELSIKSVIQGGEPGLLSIEGYRDRMRKAWGDGVDFFESAGASEIGYFGQECIAHQGLHVPEDYLFIEIIDPENGEQLGPGESGELVITHLKREGMPLVRYRIGDITSFEDDVCVCGRTHLRLQGIQGRTDDMIKVKGLKFFPTQIESLVKQIPGCTGEFLITVDKDQEDVLDTIKIQIEYFSDADKDALEDELIKSIRAFTSIKPEVELVVEGKLPRSPHKAVRLLDLRKKGAEDKFHRKLEYAKKLE
jgi:phenylacetate-CoA ligase